MNVDSMSNRRGPLPAMRAVASLFLACLGCGKKSSNPIETPDRHTQPLHQAISNAFSPSRGIFLVTTDAEPAKVKALFETMHPNTEIVDAKYFPENKGEALPPSERQVILFAKESVN